MVRDESVEAVFTQHDEGVVGDNAVDILADNQGNVWLLLEPSSGSSSGGVTKITSDFQISSITADDGLVSNEISGRYDGLAYDETRGWLWIATQEGISRYTTGFEPIQETFSVCVYPNPFIFDEYVSITFYSPESRIDRIIIYSVSGNKIKDFDDIDSDKKNWSEPGLSSGVYIYVAYAVSGEKSIGKFSIIH